MISSRARPGESEDLLKEKQRSPGSLLLRRLGGGSGASGLLTERIPAAAPRARRLKTGVGCNPLGSRDTRKGSGTSGGGVGGRRTHRTHL